MTRRFYGFLGILAGVALASGSCVKDPLSDLDGTPARLLLSNGLVVLAPGGVDTVTASVIDGRFTPLAVPITTTACDGDVIVTRDTSYHPVPNTSIRLIVRAITAGASCVVVSGGGLTDTLDVGVTPTAFAGTVGPLTPQPNDTVTINSTSELKFDTALVTVTFGGAARGSIVSKTPDQLKVLTPFSTAGTLAIAGINVTYVPGLRVTLNTTATVTPGTTNNFAVASSWQTAPDITSRLPAAAGATGRFVVTRGTPNVAVCPERGDGSTGPCMMFKFTVAAAATMNFTADWEGAALAPDVDVYHCSDSTVANFGTACFVTGGSGANAAKPQSTGNDAYAPGIYWFVIEIFGGTGPRNIYVSIARP